MGYSEKGKQGFQKTHGLSAHPLYKAWKRIKNRCYNPNSIDYKDYGERGIVMCEEWKADFMPFYDWAIENGWQYGLSIERNDFNGNYEPSNCKWIPLQDQSKNRRGCRFITYNGETHTVSEWSRILGISRETINRRLNSEKYTVEEVFEIPVNKKLARHKPEPYNEVE